jgi:hypothetical protein
VDAQVGRGAVLRQVKEQVGLSDYYEVQFYEAKTASVRVQLCAGDEQLRQVAEP